MAAEPQTIVLWPEGAPGSESKNPAKIHTVEGNALPDLKRAIRLVRSRALRNGGWIRSASESWDFPPAANWPRSPQLRKDCGSVRF